MLTLVPLLGTMGLVVGLAIAVANGSEHVSAIFVALVGALVVAMVARLVTTKDDRLWLPTLIMAGYTAKLIGSWVRWWVLVDYYGGSGDAIGYHGKAITNLVHMWRSFDVPPMDIGTTAMEGITGLLYVPYVPNLLGGFLLFGTLAFFGQILAYMAFRTSVQPRRLKLYAIAVFFVPTMVYWPSSIGKDAVMLLGIGAACYGISKLLNTGAINSLVITGLGPFLAGLIRPHISAMLAVAATVALLLAKGGGVAAFPARRILLLGFVGTGVATLLFISAANFNIELGEGLEGDVDEFVGTLESNTSKGGSSVSGGFITSPLQFPDATLRVLFRPFPNEAHNAPALASSVEGALMLLLTVWKLPAMIKRSLRIRRDPYILFSLVYTVEFIVAFSAFLNLGLMARERSQVIPAFLALIVALGFGPPKVAPGEEGSDEAQDRLQPLLAGLPVIGPVAERPPEGNGHPSIPAPS